MKLNELIDFTKDYYKGNLPKTVSEYTTSYPKGLSRQVLKSRYNITAGQFLKMIGSEYKEPNKAHDLIKSQMKLKNLSTLEDLNTKTTKCKVKFTCNTCTNTFSTTYESLKLSKYGCPECAGNKQLYLRPKFVEECADKVNALVIHIPSNNHQKICLQCKSCLEKYSVTLSKLTNPQTDLEGTCPNCRDSDKRVVYKGITFGSQFERECFKLLEHLKPGLQVRYNTHFNTNRKWVCDFVIDNYWVEVSNFKVDYKDYFKNIEDKKDLVESNGKKFVLLTSLKEVSDFIDMI